MVPTRCSPPTGVASRRDDFAVLTCPTDDTLGAHLHGALTAADAARVASHLDDCAACRAVAIAGVRAAATPLPIDALPATLPQLAAEVPHATGGRLGRYELRGLLGRGGMGHVYEAYDAELDRSIALKVLRPELAGATAMFAERLVRESRMMARVVHPAVIVVHDVGRTDDDAVFIAMELVRGETLAGYLARGALRWTEIVALFERAGAGLAAAHAAGIVHRDFKPDNVLVEAGARRVVVTDFGIARAMGELAGSKLDVQLTSGAVGTPAYMAPEQLDGGAIDARADVFAFCVALWEALFGERPFPGKTIDEIREALARVPEPSRPTRVPARLSRALQRGLAFDRDARWPTMSALLAELATIRSRPRRVAFASGALGLVGAGVAIALALARSPAREDPCARPVFYDPPRVAAALANEPATLATLANATAAWRDVHAAACRADREPALPARIAACLDARRSEITAFGDDVVADGAKYARELAVGTIGDPAACADPAPGLLVARVPDDRALRRRVTQLRYRIWDVKDAEHRGDFVSAIADATELVATTASVWPPLHAEATYVLGETLATSGNSTHAIATLRDAAALAEAAHADRIAAESWLHLVTTATSELGDPARGLEYARYAEAAVDRLGRPADVEAALLYAKGTALVMAGRAREGEVALRRAIVLAEAHAPEILPHAIQGLAFFYESIGRSDEAAAQYRRALELVGARDTAAAIVIRDRLANDLVFLGRVDEAIAIARAAMELADATYSADNLDRGYAHSAFAQVLLHAGRLADALVEARVATAAVVASTGERSERFGEALQVEAEILYELDRYADAAPLLARGCEIIAFRSGDGSRAHATCQAMEAATLAELDRHREALAIIDKAVPSLVAAYGEHHAQVANALVTRGELHGKLGHHDAAVADFERAIAILDKLTTADRGHVANARLSLAKELWRRERVRARAVLVAALDDFRAAGSTWQHERDEAAALLARR
jgi:tRNA A-37 threonylcarbamoyl transferase component Bud32/tetratricopeptide (TPR) repeat protein